MKKRIYVWEIPIRVIHWVNFVSILVLSITGLYIASPFLKPDPGNQFVMGWFLFVHFVFAYIFTATFIVRIYWWFAGNEYAGWRSYFPFGKDQRQNLVKQILFYLLIRKKPPVVIGHSPLAGLTYLAVFLVNLFSILTGFAHYSLHYPGGMMYSTFGWMFSFVSLPHIRLFHHLVIWLMLCFVMVHVYIVLFNNAIEKNGILKSIFTGYQNADTEEVK